MVPHFAVISAPRHYFIRSSIFLRLDLI